MTRMFTRAASAALAAAAVTSLAASAALAATTIRVDEDDEGGWLFNRDASTSTPYEFSLDEASIGSGSLHVLPIGSDEASDKFIAEQFLGAPTADVASISYDFLIAGDGGASDANHFYLNVYTNLPESAPDNYYDCRFDYVPSTGSTADWTTASFAATDTPTRVAGSGCPATLAGMPEGSTIRAFAINVGDTSLNDTGLAGYLDNVVVDGPDGSTTWDFEVPAPVKDACKDGGWAGYGFTNQGECVSSLQANDKAGR